MSRAPLPLSALPLVTVLALLGGARMRAHCAGPLGLAIAALVANTAPVTFGAMGTPVVTLAQVTGLPLDSVVALLLVMCLIVVVQSTFLLGWMLP